jgi:tRNA(Ile)-lysidine synthase
VQGAIEALPPGRYLLAVSGGRDSMVLLDAFASVRHGDIAAVATFDHGTGPVAVKAIAHVERESEKRGVPVITGKRAGWSPSLDRVIDKFGAASEAMLRNARWAFLRVTAANTGATVVTAHSEDDQAETVFMRILRHSRARGLAAMHAKSDVARPLLSITRAEIAEYAKECGVRWLEDPTNASMRFHRNRVRAELLPAIEASHPGFSKMLLGISERCGQWRSELAEIVDSLDVTVTPAPDRTAVVRAEALAGLTPEGLAVLWPELAGRAGAVLDWRGVERLVKEGPNVKPGAEIPLAGGVTVSRTSTTFVVRNRGVGAPLY